MNLLTSTLVFLMLATSLTNCITAQEALAPKQLISAAAAMQGFLEAMPEPNRSDWKYHFEWDKWGSELAKGRLPERKVLEGVTSRFYGVYEGLEQPSLVKMRSELQQYLHGNNAPLDLATQPGLVIRLNPTLITSQLSKFSRAKTDIRQTGNWIAGAWVTGTAYCQTNVSAELVSLGNSAAIAVRVAGAINSPHNIAHKDSFQVHSSSNSQLAGVSYLYLEKEVIRASEPQFSAQTHSQLSHVEGPRLFSRVAMRQASKKQGQGEAEGSQLIAAQATEELKSELTRELKQINEPLAEQGHYHVLLKRADLLPTLVTTALSPGSLQLGIRFPDSAAQQPLPARNLAQDTAFEVGIHESLAAPFTANFLRGSFWTDVDFARAQKELTGTSSNEMLIGAHPERWGLRWDWRKPLTAMITKDYIEYTFNFSEARIDNRNLESDVIVKSRYKPSSARWGLEFSRLGDVEVTTSTNKLQFGTTDLALLRRKFSSLLGETIYLDGLTPPAGGAWDGLAIYEISEARLEQGWFVLSARLAQRR